MGAGRALGCVTLIIAAAADFNYSFCGLPGTNADTTVNSRDPSAVCLQLNGAVRSVFTPAVDDFSAFQVVGANYAFPTGSGYLMQGYGWIPSLADIQWNCSTNSDPRTFFATVDVSYLGVTSEPRIYKQFVYDGCTGQLSNAYTWPILTVIINMNKGVPQSISWDDGCFFCASNDPTVCKYYGYDTGADTFATNDAVMSCITPMTTCYADMPSPTPTPTYTYSSSATATATPTSALSPNATASMTATPSASFVPANASSQNFTLPQSTCDLKMFVTWSGSGADGQYFVSANKRFSRFRQFGTATVFQSAINIGLQGLTIAQNTLGLVDGVPGRLLPGSNFRRRLHGAEEGALSAEEVAAREQKAQYGAHFNPAAGAGAGVDSHAGVHLLGAHAAAKMAPGAGLETAIDPHDEEEDERDE